MVWSRYRTWMFTVLAWWFGESNVPKPSSDPALPTQLLCLSKTVQLVDQVIGHHLEPCTVLKYKGSGVCLFYVVILHTQPCEPVRCRHQNWWKRKINWHSLSNILLISQKCNNRTGTLVLFFFKYKFTAQRVVEKMASKNLEAGKQMSKTEESWNPQMSMGRPRGTLSKAERPPNSAESSAGHKTHCLCVHRYRINCWDMGSLLTPYPYFSSHQFPIAPHLEEGPHGLFPHQAMISAVLIFCMSCA